jgi:DNA replication and repair protein RecF
MLRIQQIRLTHFKNYRESVFDFSAITGICGLNGIGKTNLLDSIYYSCFTRSYFSSLENLNQRFGESGFRIDATFSLSGRSHEVICIYRNGKKEIAFDNEVYEKLSRHIGRLPIVIIAPDDIQLISGISELRRKWMDALLSQADTVYLDALIAYNRVLLQRNSLLKQDHAFSKYDLLDVMDEQLIKHGKTIFDKRRNFAELMAEDCSSYYEIISGGAEKVEVKYESHFRDSDPVDLFRNSREKDLYAGRSTVGIHRDDLLFNLGENTFRQIASQGQKKSLLYSLKLSEYAHLKRQKGFPPILLLDDAFEKLDDTRMFNLLAVVCRDQEGQVIITDTHLKRLEEAFEQLKVKGQIIELN